MSIDKHKKTQCFQPPFSEPLKLWAQNTHFKSAEYTESGSWVLQANKSDGKTIIQTRLREQ